ncbi:hypothetical protein ACFCP7_01540 [Paenibacillus elgii]
MRAAIAINGETKVRQLPELIVEPNMILVRTICSVISGHRDRNGEAGRRDTGLARIQCGRRGAPNR